MPPGTRRNDGFPPEPGAARSRTASRRGYAAAPRGGWSAPAEHGGGAPHGGRGSHGGGPGGHHGEELAGGPTALLVGLPTEWHGRRSPSLRSPLGDGGTERRLIHTVPRTGSPANRTKRPAMRFRGRQARRCPSPNIQADWPTASVHLSLPYKWHRMWRKGRPG